MKTCNNYSIGKIFLKRERLVLFFLGVGILVSYLYFSSLIIGIAFLIVLMKYKGVPYYSDFESFCLLVAFGLFFFNETVLHSMSLYWNIYYCFVPIFMYMIGKYYGSKWYDEDCLFALMFILTLAIGLPHIYLTIKDVVLNGLVNPQRSLVILGEEDVATTQRTVALSLSCFGFALIMFNPNNIMQGRLRIVYIILAVLSMLCFLHYLSRTGIVLFVIMIGLGFLLSRKDSRYNWLFFMIIVIVFVLSFSSQTQQLFGLFTERQAADNSILEAGGRNIRWMTAWNAILEHPLGGVNDYYYAHNLWLDLGRHAGIVSFIALVFFSLSNLVKSYKIAKSPNTTQLVKLMVVCFSVLFLISNFTECTMDGITLYMFIYVMYCGMVNALYHKLKNV